MTVSKQCLNMFNISEFLKHYVTIVEIWISDYSPEMNEHSVQWNSPGECVLMRAKTVPLSENFITKIFWDSLLTSWKGEKWSQDRIILHF